LVPKVALPPPQIGGSKWGKKGLKEENKEKEDELEPRE
jgi:hypothetical protein